MIHLHPKALEMLRTMRVVQDHSVLDIHMVKRSITERFFSLPWNPIRRYKPIYCPAAYILRDGTVIVSPKTYLLLKKDTL